MLLITFMQNEFINTTVLPDKKKGHYKVNHSISELTEDINIDGIENRWIISAGENYTLSRYEGDRLSACGMKAVIDNGDIFVIECNGMKYQMIAETINDERNKFVKFILNDSQNYDSKISIGRNTDNDIVLGELSVSGTHAVISRRENKWYLLDDNSRNGTYLNNVRLEPDTEYPLEIGDVIFIMGYKFIICADFISANIDFEKTVHTANIMKIKLRDFERNNKKSDEGIDYFYRTVDLEINPPEMPEIRLLPPERTEVREEQSALLAMGPAMTMGISTLLVAMYSGIAAHYRGTNISYIVPTLIMAGSMITSSITFPLITRRHKKSVSKVKETKRIKDYQDYIIDLRAKVDVMKDNEKKYLCDKCLTVEECMTRAINRDRYLWSKSINDDDFMTISIGTGKKKSSVVVKYSADNEVFFKDNLRYDMMQFANEDRILDGVPITVSLNNGCICGISGDKERSFDIIKEMVIQLTSLYSYDELKLVFIYNEDEEEKWSYAKWLPHVWNADNTFRYVASTSDDIKELSYELEKEIENRTTRKNDDFPKMLIIASDKHKVDSIDIMPVIMKNREKLNFSLLTSFGLYNYNNSDFIIELTDSSPKLYDRKNDIVSEFLPYRVNNEADFETYLNRIANIKLDINTEKYQLPKMLTFLDMFRVSKVEHLNSLARWVENNPIKSLKTEIGIAPSGDTFFIDMHEKFHGPHGLMAGTTGSGKSETIITIILSLAVNYSPEEVAFVIVDYKGGGLADAFNEVREETIDGKTVEVRHILPHVVGTVTNLDGATIERACISIDTEIKRRQFLFKKARKISNEGTMDIYKYQQLRREGAELEALPHLFIVCDEFAELKADEKNGGSKFMDVIVSASRIGRSLGVHLILATQKPDGSVKPEIWSNSRFKICLKVQGREDSQAVLHCPDAAEINTTGRFFFQVGYNEVFSMGQSAWCGADYIEAEEFVKRDIESVEVISNTGTVIHEKVKKPEIKINPEKDKTVSQLIAVREYLIDIAKDIEIRSLWLDPIPAKLSIRDLYEEYGKETNTGFVQLEPVIGKKDDLYERKQEIMTIPFSRKGNLAIYGAAGSGLDMFFVTLIYSLIYNYTPEQVNIYVLDFDAGFLKTYAKAPHVGDVVIADEEDDVRSIILSVKDEIVRRSKLFAEQGGEYARYCRNSGNTLPAVVLMLNNYTEFVEKFKDSDLSDIMYIAREGVKRGIYLVIGTSSVNINFRLKQYIQQTFMLKMNDINDYAGVIGRTGGISPSDCAGSGIIKENDITYKFQIADIFDIVPCDEDETPSDDASKEVKTLCRQMIEKYPDSKAVSFVNVQMDTETILENNIEYNNVPVGMTDNDVYYYDFSDKYITFVSSLSQKHLTQFAGYFAKALAKDKNISVVLLDSSGKLRQENAEYRYYSSVEELQEWNIMYKNIAEERCAKLILDENRNCVMSENAQHMYVIINSFTDICTADDTNLTIVNLKSIINNLPEIHLHYIILDTSEKMYDSRGAYIHIIRNIDESEVDNFENIDKENNREWFDASSMWLGDGISSFGLCEDVNAPSALSENEAVVVQNRKAVKKFKYFR
ncbi:MAG: type VII secretion protein EssC [Ruminococcus flavefaciens]|nr:type VII secretion protein EssC [Ruminococcus flavefaciens]